MDSCQIRLKLSKDVDMEEGATLLHPILSSSEEFKGTVGLLMEEAILSLSLSLSDPLSLSLIVIGCPCL